MMSVDYQGNFDAEEVGLCPVRGGRIWYRVNGKRHFACGATPLLCVHGGPGLSHHYLLSLTLLAQYRPVIFYDQLDSGSSDRPNDRANWTVTRFVDEIDALRVHLHLGALDLFGSSWGGTIAAEYAMRRPSGLGKLILASPVINTHRWIADCTAYRERLPQEVQEVLDSHEATGSILDPAYQDAVMVFYKRHLCRCEPWPWEIEHAFELFNYDLYRAMWGPAEFTADGILKDYDSSNRLSEIEVPTLFTCGEHDEATPAACQDFAEMMGNARVEIAEGCSHTAHLESPVTYLKVVKSFLSGSD